MKKRIVAYIILYLGLVLCLLPSKTVYIAQPSPKKPIEVVLKPIKAPKPIVKYKKVVSPTTTPLVIEMANKVSHETGVSPVILGRIILAESGGDPDCISYNRNKTHDSGLFQINSIWLPQAKKMGLNLLDPDDNATMAIYLIKSQGLKPWNSSRQNWI